MGVPISERLKGNSEEFYRRMLENFASNLRVAAPGIIQEFDPVTQTVNVQIAIREKIIDSDMLQHWVEIPLLLDVPIVIPRAGGFALTLPVKPGDECLVIFADSCIDAWFSSGGVQNQIERRRHDLSDGFALLGVWSQPRTLQDYSMSSVQIRTDDGATRISMSPGEIDIVASVVKINGVPWRN
ncbi:Gp138 family membrane-puncturing spike protein [Paenibacillus elgii]|uniref:Gp138 family membrane-puncturing spike protein n=1 Tax=Paenibacillus elgii TaxID=189691 RepID=UPI0013D20FB8|nr:Gp138 family membrane-puncturing spike protein [Paenibacillus elgii]